MSRRRRERPPDAACGRDVPALRSPRARRFVALMLLSVVASAGLAAASDEGELLRSLKSDVFDRLWPQVLTKCDRFIALYPRSQTLPRAYYYRAQALESLKRYEDAIEAYSEFLKRFPGETGALKEDVVLRRITLARIQFQNGAKGHVGVILEGMDEEGATQIYAAIEASKIDHAPARKKAIPILKDCAQFETQEELKSECVVALLRIDPKLVPQGPPATGPSKCSLIKFEVFNKLQKKGVVRINLPLAFADMLLEAINEHYRKMIEDKLAEQAPGTKLPDFRKMLEAIRSGECPQTILEIDRDEESIRVWIE